MRLSWFRRVLSVLSWLILGCAGCAANRAALFEWRGYADTEQPFAEFFREDHTVMLWFLPQYVHAYAGPLVASSDGEYVLALGDYRGLGRGGSDLPGVKLTLKVGRARRDYFLPRSRKPLSADGAKFETEILEFDDWQHVAVVRRGLDFHVYWNGGWLKPETARFGGVVPGPFSQGFDGEEPAVPEGNLRFGRVGPGRSGELFDHEAQFYGLIDDVAVMRRALSAGEIRGIWERGEGVPHGEAARTAAWTFEGGTTEFVPPARRVSVSKERISEVDRELLPPPRRTIALQLPFPRGEEWIVLRGIDVPSGENNGYQAFSWTFRPRGGRLAAEGKPVAAAAGGKVAAVEDGLVWTESGPANYVSIEHAPGEFVNYLHLEQGSAAVRASRLVQVGDELGRVGDVGVPDERTYQLRFSVSNVPESEAEHRTTFPVGFSDYERSSDGETWERVEFGLPRSGEFVRRPVPAGGVSEE